jgi:hypothetical protein
VAATVTTIVTYDCGCGYRTDDERAAVEHAGETGHTMTIHGRVLTETDGNTKD